MVTVIKKSASKKEIEKKLKSVNPPKPKKLFNVNKFSGKIKYKEDAISIQKKLRNEWN